MLDTPILFIIFNRPDKTKQVFEAIRLTQPKKLFVAADGPRERNCKDKELCEIARAIVDKIDWPCEVKRLYRKNNLGSRIAITSAISWFFDNVEQGIILEDDCIPNKSFFHFCENLLDFYKTDENVMHISGTNFRRRVKRGRFSYYFSNYAHVWGWATWRRAWKKYDSDMAGYGRFKENRMISNISKDKKIQAYWTDLFSSHRDCLAWDHNWLFSIWENRGVSITPNVNLVSNIGFGDDATHCKKRIKKYDLAAREIGSLEHPASIKADASADDFFYKDIIKNPESTVEFFVRQIGRIGILLKEYSPRTYRILKPYFPDKIIS